MRKHSPHPHICSTIKIFRGRTGSNNNYMQLLRCRHCCSFDSLTRNTLLGSKIARFLVVWDDADVVQI